MDPEDPDNDPDHSENLIISSFYLFSYFVHKQTDEQTDKPRENITSLDEVNMELLKLYVNFTFNKNICHSIIKFKEYFS